MSVLGVFLIGLLAAPPEYAALIHAPQAMRMRGDMLMVASEAGLAWFRLERGQLSDPPAGPVGQAPDLATFRADATRRTYAIGGNTWTLTDARSPNRVTLRRNRTVIASDLRGNRLVGLGRLGVLVMATGDAAKGVGDLIRFDIEGREVWRSAPAPKPTAGAFDRQRQAAWVGIESGGIDRWRLADGTRIRAIPSGRSEPIKCVSRQGDRMLIADTHRGLWLWIGRRVVLHHRFDTDIASVHVKPEIGAYLRSASGVFHWRLPDGEPPSLEWAAGVIDCSPRRNPQPDDSLGLDGVRYVMRADGHWRSELGAQVIQGRVPGRDDR
ncbi:MAG: hypothetical protein ACI9U2_001513 [Bradymonadia bacterium]|jgi:hypothetical protein